MQQWWGNPPQHGYLSYDGNKVKMHFAGSWQEHGRQTMKQQRNATHSIKLTITLKFWPHSRNILMPLISFTVISQGKYFLRHGVHLYYCGKNIVMKQLIFIAHETKKVTWRNKRYFGFLKYVSFHIFSSFLRKHNSKSIVN